MDIACGITTCQRKGVSYIQETVVSLIAAGFEVGDAFDDREYELGSFGNFKRTLEWLVHNRPLADAVCIFQDDIRVSAGLRAWLDKTLWPESVEHIGVLSLYTGSGDASPERGWRKLPIGDTINEHGGKRWALGNGALGLLFPMRSARFFVADNPRTESRTKTDMWVGEWCEKRGLSWWSHNPSLISHIGEVSTLSGVGLVPARREAEFLEDCATL